jgi:hypothetical protein
LTAFPLARGRGRASNVTEFIGNEKRPKTGAASVGIEPITLSLRVNDHNRSALKTTLVPVFDITYLTCQSFTSDYRHPAPTALSSLKFIITILYALTEL